MRIADRAWMCGASSGQSEGSDAEAVATGKSALRTSGGAGRLTAHPHPAMHSKPKHPSGMIFFTCFDSALPGHPASRKIKNIELSRLKKPSSWSKKSCGDLKIRTGIFHQPAHPPDSYDLLEGFASLAGRRAAVAACQCHMASDLPRSHLG
jgi:hypothetical protein